MWETGPVGEALAWTGARANPTTTANNAAGTIRVRSFFMWVTFCVFEDGECAFDFAGNRLIH